MSGQSQIEGASVLQQLPAKTPKWAVGAVAIIIALASSFVTVYMISQDEIQQFLGWAEARHEARDEKLVTEYTSTLQMVLSLVDTNSAQITELSKTLGAAQQQNAILSDRVAALERFLQLAKGDLELCETKLKSCVCRKE